MLKMILADDEPVITRGIQKLVDWKMLGIEIIGSYDDGKKALEGILKWKPDLALLDISMPGMTGVEILKECQYLQVNTKVIFISGFQDFEYAKAAVKYGAIDYLLKPVIREELLNAVEKYLAVQPREQDNTVVMTEADEERTADYGKLVEVEDNFYIPVYPEIQFHTGEDAQIRKLIRFSFVSFLEEYLEEKKIGIVFIKSNHLVLVLKGIEESGCEQILEELCQAAMAIIDHRITFIIGKQVAKMGDIPIAFAECLQMKGYLFFADQLPQHFIRTGKKVFGGNTNSSRLGEIQNGVLDAIIGQNMDAFQQAYRQYGKIVCRLADGKKEDACFYFCTLIRLIDSKLQMMGLPAHDNDPKMLLEQGRNTECYGELLEVYQKMLSDYVEAVKNSLVSNDKKDILRAKEYIEKHYQENLTLGVLAAEVHMNSYYFSSFFKKQAGENFKDYVNKVRMEHAVSLLLSTDKKTYEIAGEVGFGDARAFNEIFQRLYHETPSAYRKRVSRSKPE